ncbi:putative MFS family arabinose efflux permease [Microbacterium phyllosphaerae]|uniref:MFS family arabinose efflux permease n=1 Tax=Microbacterium phyllosphaerae TaxID=124798 RepID=A0ABS4WLT2_9MICO|nr:MFS transporter [Microbacterium phyllosphaerae]MBP2377157.1 putative MFS family arabinose efflux permease [Microbacterium phyllosphaerae]
MSSSHPDPEQVDEGGEGRAATKGLFARLSGALSDPVLRALVTATSVSRVGRGVFLAVTVLFFTQIIGLSPAQAAIVLAVSSGCGVVASFLGGWLADRWSARRLAFGFEAIGGVLLAAYAFVGDFASALLLASLAGFFDTLGHSARSAIIARGFAPEKRVHARAVLRTVTNLAIAAGSGIGAIALALGTAEAYRIVIACAGVICALGSLPLLRLTATVDAPARTRTRVLHTETGSIDTHATAAASAERKDWNRRSPWRDPRYLLLSGLSAIFGMQFGVAELGVPLWITENTNAPEATFAVLLIINTALVVLFQVRASRGTHDVRTAGRVTMIAGWLMVAACIVYALAAGLPAWAAIVILIVGMITHTFAEILSQAGAWGLSFELADPVRAGAYQGVFGMGFSLGALASPIVVNATAITFGFAGWAMLAAIFLAAAFGIWLIARRAAASATAPASA